MLSFHLHVNVLSDKSYRLGQSIKVCLMPVDIYTRFLDVSFMLRDYSVTVALISLSDLVNIFDVVCKVCVQL